MKTTHFFHDTLLTWFSKNARDLPWRHTRDPYRIWISEVMLQQTQVDRVIGFYERFLARFPSVEVLAKATWPQVLAKWRGLGYYRRGRSLLAAAKKVVQEYDGTFPRSPHELEELPGIGPYTARAIAAFAYEDEVLVLDTNTTRVLGRFFAWPQEKLLQLMAEQAHQIVPKKKSWAFHQALMDFGSSVCSAKGPRCGSCPLQSKCQAYQRGIHLQTAARKKTKTGTKNNSLTPVIDVAVAVIHRQGKVLITKRPGGKHLQGLWEFPGGKKEKKETWRDCLKREIQEELGLEIAVRPHDWAITHTYPGKTVQLRFHRCSILKGKPQSREGQEFRWVHPHELAHYEFPAANKAIVEKLQHARFIDPQA